MSPGNLGPGERRKRLRLGVAALGAGIAIGTALNLASLERWWGIGLFLLFWLGALGLFQGLENT